MSHVVEVGNSGPLGNTEAPLASAEISLVPSKLIARIWHGQTLANKADEYTKYLYEAGVRSIAAFPGNRGVQMFRMMREGIADFRVLSYWDSIEAIKLFAGNDYEKVRHLPKDAEYMIGMEPEVHHFEVIVNDRPQR